MRLCLTLLLALGLSACPRPGASTAAAAPGTWSAHAPLPIRVQEIYPALHAGRIWVAGGLSPDVPASQAQMSDRVLVYDPTADRWTDGPRLPEPRHHPVLVSAGDALYAFGGFVQANGGRWSNSRDVLRLNADADRWDRVATLPMPLSETVAGVIGDTIWLATGRSPSGSGNAQWPDHADTAHSLAFDPDNLTFRAGPAAPQALNSAAGAVIGGKLLVVGGRTVSGGNRSDLQIFDPATGTWTRGPDLPQAQGGLAAAALDGRLYVFGGEFFNAAGGGVSAEAWMLDSDARWQALPDMPVPRHGLGAVTVGNRIFVIGGATAAGGNGTSARLSSFQPG